MSTSRSANGLTAAEILMAGAQRQESAGGDQSEGKHLRTSGAEKNASTRVLSIPVPSITIVTYSPFGISAANSRRGRLRRNMCIAFPKYFLIVLSPRNNSQMY